MPKTLKKPAAAKRPSAKRKAPPALGRLLETIPDPLLVVEKNLRIYQRNRAAREIFEPGQNLLKVLPQLVPLVTRAFREAHLPPEEISLPGPVLHSYIATVSPLEGGRVALFLHDITALRRSEELRADFVANVSHELKTPLASLIGCVETLQGPAQDNPADRRKFLGIMQEQSERMNNLVQDLLSLARIEFDEHSRPSGSVALIPLARRAVTLLEGNAARLGIIMIVNEKPSLPNVIGDEQQLLQVMVNLVENAIVYTHEETAVEINFLGSREGFVHFAVKDYGPGIAPEHLPRLTERFYRVDKGRSRQRGGTGLGLAIVKHIVNRHRGRFEIKSKLGEGSEFCVSLPIAGRREVS